MNWPGGTCFAPESLLDDKGRRIFWAWVLEARSGEAQAAAGWSGVMTMPRILSLRDDGAMLIEPPEEFESLRLNHRSRRNVRLERDAELVLDDVAGDCLELALEVEPAGAAQFGLKVRRAPDGAEETVICCDPAAGTLSIDTTRSSLSAGITRPFPIFQAGKQSQDVTVQTAPFKLKAGERLKLRVFLDRSIIEVFANSRQCVTQRIYPSRPDSLGAALFSRGGSANVNSLDAWDIAAANAW